MDVQTDAALLGRACRIANEAVHAVALQHRRLRSAEPEDNTFVMRWWADLQFLIVALRRLRRAGELAAHSPAATAVIQDALKDFDQALPSLATMRNIGEHLDAYALDSPKRHDKSIDRRQLEVGSWDGTTLHWLVKQDGSDHELDIDVALSAAGRFYDALRRATRSAKETS